jgi:hypothetical protein
MDQPTREWQELCEAASKEPDPKKLMPLITEMVKMIDDRCRKSAVSLMTRTSRFLCKPALCREATRPGI